MSDIRTFGVIDGDGTLLAAVTGPRTAEEIAFDYRGYPEPVTVVPAEDWTDEQGAVYQEWARRSVPKGRLVINADGELERT